MVFEEFYLLGYKAVQPVENQPMFRSNILPPAELVTCFMVVSCLAYYSTLQMTATCSSETLVKFNGLGCFIRQETELFITAAVRTSQPHLFTCRASLFLADRMESTGGPLRIPFTI
jgi:hypothetical protein